jgi:hypothetical protein
MQAKFDPTPYGRSSFLNPSIANLSKLAARDNNPVTITAYC